MQRHELEAAFNEQAASYDRQWARLAPVRDGLHFLIGTVFAELPEDARILCVGVGTGAEIASLARRYPLWHFTALDPSEAMLDACRRRVEEQGLGERVNFHDDYVDTLPLAKPYDAATCILVSQFMLDTRERSGFFRGIANRLKPGGMLATADLAADVRSDAYEDMLVIWLRMMKDADVDPEVLERVRSMYSRDVGVLPPAQVAGIIEAGGFDAPIPFFQAGLMHGWYARRAAGKF